MRQYKGRRDFQLNTNTVTQWRTHETGACVAKAHSRKAHSRTHGHNHVTDQGVSPMWRSYRSQNDRLLPNNVLRESYNRVLRREQRVLNHLMFGCKVGAGSTKD